jgi:predicted Ser/Thr protein kinase
VQLKDLLQPKELLKKNSITVVDGKNEVIKVVGTPFSSLTRIWCRHEAGCLLKLAELGFANAPKLISSTENSFTMEKIEGAPLLRGRKFIDVQLFLRLMDVVSELHSFGFTHGNLRPNNILIKDGNEPALIDFETCCKKHSPLFLLSKFSDHMRLYLLWQSHVVKSNPELVRSKFPGYLPPAMLVITLIFRFWGIVKSAKKSLKRSLKVSAGERDAPSKSERKDAGSVRKA